MTTRPPAHSDIAILHDEEILTLDVKLVPLPLAEQRAVTGFDVYGSDGEPARRLSSSRGGRSHMALIYGALLRRPSSRLNDNVRRATCSRKSTAGR